MHLKIILENVVAYLKLYFLAPFFLDIDECDPELRPKRHNCHQQAKCNNTIGSFTCHCKAGYDGDGVKNCIGLYLLFFDTVLRDH